MLEDTTRKLTIWTIYKHPSDYPDEWVLRAHDVPGGPRFGCATADTLQAIRRKVPLHLHCLARSEDDDPAIYEVWV